MVLLIYSFVPAREAVDTNNLLLSCLQKYINWCVILFTEVGEKNSLTIIVVLNMTSQGTLDCLTWISYGISSKVNLIL